MLTHQQPIVKTELLHPTGIEDTVSPRAVKKTAKESKAERRLRLNLHAEQLQLEAERLKAEYEQAKLASASNMSNFLSEVETIQHEKQVLRKSVEELTLKQSNLEKVIVTHRFKRVQAEQNAKLWRTERNKAKAEVAKLQWKLQLKTERVEVQGTEAAAIHEKVAQQETEIASLRSALLEQKKKGLAKVRKINNKWAQYIMQNLV